MLQCSSIDNKKCAAARSGIDKIRCLQLQLGMRCRPFLAQGCRNHARICDFTDYIGTGYPVNGLLSSCCGHTHMKKREIKLYCRNFALHAQAIVPRYGIQRPTRSKWAADTCEVCDCIRSWDRIRKVTNTYAYSTSTSLSGRTCRRYSEIVLSSAGQSVQKYDPNSAK